VKDNLRLGKKKDLLSSWEEQYFFIIIFINDKS